ncbi:MAG: MFS transporter [Bifidobacterium sp.]|jgi:MFS family permease|nr:MFS transporter [Bifidobacterium sp.]
MQFLQRATAPDRNLRLYCLYLASTGFVLDRAVFLVYMGQHGLNVQQAALCEAIFQLGTVLFEIPTGWVSDRFGRKASMFTGTALLAAYNIGMLLAHGFIGYIFMMLLCAFAYTFLSGSDTSLLYELVETEHSSKRYLSYSSKAMAGQQIMMGISAFLGGLLAAHSWTLLYLLMGGVYVVELAMLAAVHEPKHNSQDASQTIGITSRPGTDNVAAGRAHWRIHSTHWTTYAPVWAFVGFLAASVTLDTTAMSYQNSSQIIFAAAGISLPAIGLFAASSRLANAAAYLLTNQLAKRFKRTTVCIWLCAAQAISFVILPIVAPKPAMLLLASLLALFIPEMVFILAESIIQDYLVSATRAQVLSVVSMMRSLAGAAIYALIGTLLKLWNAQVTLIMLASLTAGLVVMTISWYCWILRIRGE